MKKGLITILFRVIFLWWKIRMCDPQGSYDLSTEHENRAY